jgi:maltose-binding protein MalE
MKTSFTLGTGLLALLLSLTGCQAETTEAGLPEEFDFEKSQEQPEEIDVIRIWAPSNVSNALLGVSLLFENDYGVDIQFTELQLAEIESRLESSNYPDVFFGPHSWNADLAQSGVVSKLRTDVLAESIPQNLRDAFAFEEDYYGVPMSEEHVALVCNSELISEQPSFEDMQEFGVGLGVDSEIDYPHHLYSLMSSFGLSLNDPQLTQFDSDSGYEFASWMSSRGSKLFDPNSDYSSTLEDFNEEKIGCWLTGPRSIGSIDSELQDTLMVYPVPAPGNVQSGPLADVSGFYVAANSDDPVYANSCSKITFRYSCGCYR